MINPAKKYPPKKQAGNQAALLARFPEEGKNPVVRVSGDGTLLYMNRAAESVLREWELGIGVKLPQAFMEQLNQCLEDEECLKEGLECEIEDQRLVFIPILINGTDPLLLYGQAADRWRKYGEHLNLLANVFENVIESIVITDADGHIEQVNPAFTAITGYEPEEVIGKTPRILRSDKHEPEFYKWMWSEIKHKGVWKGTIWNRRKNGEIYPALLSIAAIKNNAGRTTHYCSICHDVTEKKYNEDRMWFEAYHDVLTGLPSKQLFYDRLDRAFTRAEREKTMLAILLVGLDGFGKLNDQWGYKTGDLILQAVAQRPTGSITGDDTIARYMGDEFTMIIGESGGETAFAKTRGEHIIKTLSVPIHVQESEFRIRASIGISIYPLDALDRHSLLDNALKALQSAKNQGGGQVVLNR